jgi:hypothetical protein
MSEAGKPDVLVRPNSLVKDESDETRDSYFGIQHNAIK